MLKSLSLSLLTAGLLLTAAGPARAKDAPSKSKTVRIGAVAYAPRTVTIFQGIKRYLNKHGLQSDYVLYSNYNALQQALKEGDVDIAWNTPLAHARYHLACGGKSKTLAMRDVDRGLRAVVIARVDSSIQSAKELSVARFVLGNRNSTETYILPLYQLKKQGIEVDVSKAVRLDGKGSRAKSGSSPRHVLAALKRGRGEVGIIRERMWRSMEKQQKKSGKTEFRLVWKSPSFSHCVFTAAADFDEKLAKRFTKLMLAMDPKKPATADIMRLEGTKKWFPGSQEGFEDLFKAVGK